LSNLNLIIADLMFGINPQSLERHTLGIGKLLMCTRLIARNQTSMSCLPCLWECGVGTMHAWGVLYCQVNQITLTRNFPSIHYYMIWQHSQALWNVDDD